MEDGPEQTTPKIGSMMEEEAAAYRCVDISTRFVAAFPVHKPSSRRRSPTIFSNRSSRMSQGRLSCLQRLVAVSSAMFLHFDGVLVVRRGSCWAEELCEAQNSTSLLARYVRRRSSPSRSHAPKEAKGMVRVQIEYG